MNFSNRTTNFILIGMLIVDFGFVFASTVQTTQGTRFTPWHVSSEGGFAERWQYVKWAMLTVVMTDLAIRTRSLLYLAWSVVFLYLLIDDATEVHEQYGGHLAVTFGFTPAIGLRAQDFGELLVTAIAALCLLSLLTLAYLNSTGLRPLQFTRRMIPLLAALAFFGVGVDMLDIAAPWRAVRTTLQIVEDGGEMVVASLMSVLALQTAWATNSFDLQDR